MPISHQYKAIFVHIPKTGGTSIERMSGLWGLDNQGSQMISHKTLFGYEDDYNNALQHLTCLEIKKIVPNDVFSKYLKFAFVRNPYERLVSQYYWKIKQEIIDETMSFRDFVNEVAVPGKSFDRHLFNQADYITDIDGKVMVDHVLRFENFDSDVKMVFDILQLKIKYVLHVHLNVNPNIEHYSTYYDHSLRRIVEKLYQRDIKFFGYRFKKKSLFLSMFDCFKKDLPKGLPKNFDWLQYLENYPQLKNNGINTKIKAEEHWLEFGKKIGCAYLKPEKLQSFNSNTQLKTGNVGKVVLVGAARNEGAFLLEWICYHKLLGFDNILIYSNNNEDGSDELLEHLNRAGFIQYFNTTGQSPRHVSVQGHALSKAFNSDFVQNCEWMCVLDIDEFLVLNKHEMIQDFLKDYPQVDGIAFNWKIFNSSNHFHYPKGLILDNFRYFAVSDTLQMRRVKMIARVRSILDWFNPHFATFKTRDSVIVFPDATLCFDSNMQNLNYSDGIEVGAVNHYFFRSFEDFLVKRFRGGGMNLAKYVHDPQRYKDFDSYRNFNSDTGIYDDKVTQALSYQKLSKYMQEIIVKYDLGPTLEKIITERSVLIEKCLKLSPAKRVEHWKKVLASRHK